MGGETAPELIAVLEDAQRLGFLGSRPIPQVIDHARGFVRVLQHRGSIATVLDLGSGGGVPGLVIAHDLPWTHVTLLDRRAKRTDALERFVRRLGWQHRVSVVCEDVETFDGAFDAVVARGFGPPEFTLSSGARLVRPGHPIVISEPPGVERWDDHLLAHLGLHQVQPPQAHPAEPVRDDAAGGAAALRRVDADSPAPRLDGLVAVFIKD